MKKYDIIAFDLDGTLTNPEHGLLDGFVYAFRKLGIEYKDRESLKKFIGPPLFSEWKKEFNFTDDEADRAVVTFREYYNIYGWWDNKIYPGIEKMLLELKKRGKTLILATSKPEDTAKKVLSLFKIEKYFDFIGGADGHRLRDKKCEVLEYGLSFLNIGKSKKDREKCIMIGDRRFDYEGAQKCGIDALGILWGHGSEEELRGCDFKYICKNADEVLEILK